jgi:two-component system sensor histidine kinase UhpB
MEIRALPLYWRVFAVNTGLLALIAVLLLVTPVTISASIALTEALTIVAGLVVTVVANALLLRRAVNPLERLAERMDTVDLTTFGRASGVRVERQFDKLLPKLPPDTELAVYRIAQESLTNVARHSQATRVTIALEGGLDSVVLRVADDGRGFDSMTTDEHGGLCSMRERALLVAGALSIRQASAGGVEVRLEVPATRVAEPVEVQS